MAIPVYRKLTVDGGVTIIAVPSLYPPQTTLSAVTPQVMAKPAYLVPVIDNSFGYPMKITRVTTNSANFDSPASPYNLEPGYSKRQSWNLDGTFLRISRQYLLNGKTYVFDHKIAGNSYQGLWSNTIANKLFQFAIAGQIRTYNPVTKVQTLIYDFANTAGFTFDANSMEVGPFEGNIDKNDKYVIFNFKRAAVDRFIKFDLQLLVIEWDKSRADLGAPDGFDWISMSQSGDRIVGRKWMADGVTALYCTVYDGAGAVVVLDAGGGSHPDMGYNSIGNEVITGMNYPAYWNMATGVKTELITVAAWNAVFGTNSAGGHSTNRNIDLPGWVFLGMSTLPSTTTVHGKNEIMAVKTDGSGTIMRFVHDRGTSAGSRGSHACPNRDGTKISFASDWGDASGDYDGYVVELG